MENSTEDGSAHHPEEADGGAQDPGHVLHQEHEAEADHAEHEGHELGDDRLPGVRDVEAAAELEQVRDADRGQAVEAAADCAQSAAAIIIMILILRNFSSSPEDPGHEEPRQPGHVPHQLHHEQREHLVLAVHLGQSEVSIGRVITDQKTVLE